VAAAPGERLYLITDRHVAGGAAPMLARVARALAGVPRGSVLVQLRDKDLGDEARVRIGRDLRAICRAAGARLLVNGSLEVARAILADGVHLVDDDTRPVAAVRAALGEGAIIGASTHTVARAGERARAGVDFVTLGPVWATESKPGAAPIGVAPLAEAAQLACVLALGGVDGVERAHLARRAGAHGVAVIRAVLAAADPAQAAAALVEALA
jgi:thiamine-phosphate pyrophosphorylase